MGRSLDSLSKSHQVGQANGGVVGQIGNPDVRAGNDDGSPDSPIKFAWCDLIGLE
jgi:hypothetical protein